MEILSSPAFISELEILLLSGIFVNSHKNSRSAPSSGTLTVAVTASPTIEIGFFSEQLISAIRRINMQNCILFFIILIKLAKEFE